MTIPSNDEIREAMMKVPARVAEIISEGNQERYKFTYALMMKEIIAACEPLGKPGEEKPPNPNGPQSQASKSRRG